MATEHFDAVTIEGEGVGMYINVSNTLQVAHLLAKNWPEERGPAYKNALRTSMDRISGNASANDVRTAFVAAAKEAGILVGKENNLSPDRNSR